MSWSLHDLHADVGAPPAAEGPAAYLLQVEGTRHVVYRESGGADGPTPAAATHLWELYAAADGVWHPKDITAEAEAPDATAGPTAYAFEDEGSQHVLFQTGDGGLHELYQADGWHHNDLADAAGIAKRVVGQAHGWASVPLATQFVVFRMTDSRVHLIHRRSDGDGGWVHTVLTGTNDPNCAGEPSGYAFGSSVFVTYRDSGGRLYELSRTGSGSWTAPVDLWAHLPVQPPSFPVLPQALGDAPSGYADEIAGARYVQFLASGGRICEYAFQDGTSSLTDLTAAAFTGHYGLQGYRPTGYIFESAPHAARPTEHSIYVGASGDQAWLQELWRYTGGTWSGGWSMTVGSLPGSPAAFADVSEGSQHIFFTDVNHRVLEARWTGSRVVTLPSGPIRPRAPLSP